MSMNKSALSVECTRARPRIHVSSEWAMPRDLLQYVESRSKIDMKRLSIQDERRHGLHPGSFGILDLVCPFLAAQFTIHVPSERHPHHTDRVARRPNYVYLQCGSRITRTP